MTSKHIIIREVKLFEFYKKHVWPVQRLFVGKHLTPRCKKCILPESYTPLVDGLCEFCRADGTDETVPNPVEMNSMQDELSKLMITAQKRKDLRYHILLLFSGGKDSSYMLYKMRKEYPELRILAMTVDNTFMSPVAMENIGEIIKSMGVDHMTIRPRSETMEKMFRYAFTHLNEKGCSGTVDQFDGDFFSDVARNIAASMKIPYILCGLSRTQVQTILHLDSFITSPTMEAQKRVEVAGITLTDVFDEHEMKHWWNGTVWPEERRPQMVFPFYIWNHEESFIKSEVLRLGLMPRGDESPLITNNSLIPLMGIVDMIQFGYSSFEPEFARMVRQGKAERREWQYIFETLEYAAKTGYLLGKSIDVVLDRLSLTRNDLGIKGGYNDRKSNGKNTSVAVETPRA